jgi:hypothetical protein
VGQTWASRIGRVAVGVEDGVECLWSVMGKTGLLDGAKRADSGAIVARKTMAMTREIGHRYLLTNILTSGMLKCDLNCEMLPRRAGDKERVESRRA